VGRPLRFLTIVLAGGLVAACGFGQSSYNPVNWFGSSSDERITAWVGQNADYLVEALGEPKRTTDLAGGARELAFHDGTSETGADANCMVWCRSDPFNVGSPGQVFADNEP